jgi:RNA polymerase sigma factor (TIGR02999 family)
MLEKQIGLGNDVTSLLNMLGKEREGTLDRLIPLIYDELRKMAHSLLCHERPNHTLCTVGLVNETYEKFCQQKDLNLGTRREFFSFASQCMRRILVDYARARLSQKRHDGVKAVAFEDANISISETDAKEIYEIDEALSRLEKAFLRGSQVVQYRLFGGLSLDETAEVLDVSKKTIQRDWTAAIAWLRKEVSKDIDTVFAIGDMR